MFQYGHCSLTVTWEDLENLRKEMKSDIEEEVKEEFEEKFQEAETQIENLGKELNKTRSLVENNSNMISSFEINQNETDLIIKNHTDQITELKNHLDLQGEESQAQVDIVTSGDIKPSRKGIHICYIYICGLIN